MSKLIEDTNTCLHTKIFNWCVLILICLVIAALSKACTDHHNQKHKEWLITEQVRIETHMNQHKTMTQEELSQHSHCFYERKRRETCYDW